MFVCCSHENTKTDIRIGIMQLHHASMTDVASLDGCGCRNSNMKLPSKREKGPEMTGSSKFVDFAGIVRS